MSEAMVRVLSVLCPVHGERLGDPQTGPIGRYLEAKGRIVEASELRSPLRCTRCLRDGGVTTQVVFATEPVEV